MNRSQTFLAILTFTALLLVAGLAALPATADPAQDAFVYLPFVITSDAPVDFYETGFDSGIGSWQAVRWTEGAPHEVSHNDGCHFGECGMLDVKVSDKTSYVIASPLIPGPDRSFRITFRARLQDAKNTDQYGAVFAADRSGASCPGNNTDGCFNQYYEFRVRYRDDGEKYLEYRIRRVDGHDAGNVEFGDDIIEWTRAENVDPEDWNKWEISFRASGHLEVRANNQDQPAFGRDNKFLEQRYFGLMAYTNESSETYAHFDSFKIEKED